MKKCKIYTLPKDTEDLTGQIMATLINNHQGDRRRYKQLESYIINDNDGKPIMTRESPNPILTVNNFAVYIMRMNAGYLLGTPVEYQAKQGVKIDPIIDAYTEQSISDLDSELAEDCSAFGRAFENVYVDEDSAILSARLDPSQTIVIYDNTMKHNKIFALNFVNRIKEDGSKIEDEFDITYWTTTHEITGTLKGTTFTQASKRKHYFGEVPVIEYINNRRMFGDYEPVISLIDAYNILQSDRVLDREKLVDAILAFYGARSLTDEQQEHLKQYRTIGLPENSKAEYIIKNIDEAGADVLRKTLAQDIHKFSMTPDLSDENFASNSSGVAILYKLLAFEQNIKVKERYFNKGLMNRLKLYSAILGKKSKLTNFNVRDVDIIFKRSLPKNDLEISQMINNLRDIVDDESLVGQLSFVRDASETVEKARKEREAELQGTGFGTTNPNEGESE